jgi:acyl-CoA thioesterase FadM
MPRVKIELPPHFDFICKIPVRITDMNYGGHVGNDAILAIIHEARMQFLHHFGYTEMNFAGNGMIMADVAIEFKSELFYGDTVIASVAICELYRIGFDMIYKLEKEENDIVKTVALAKTGMICFDYDKKKIVAVPMEAKEKFSIR